MLDSQAYYSESRIRRVSMSYVSATAIAAIALVIFPLVFPAPYIVYISTLVLIYCIGAMSLHLIFRFGHICLCHAAFMGLGGYTSALLTTSFSVPWPVAVVASVLVAGTAALLIGPIILRLTGVYFVLITFALGEVMRLAFVEWIGLTGGSDGIDKIPPPADLFLEPLNYYYLALAAAFLCWMLCARLLQSDIGKAMEAIRENETLAESNGIPVFRIKIIVFVLACSLVAVQGSLEAHFVRYISPVSYGFSESLRFIVMNIVGGLNTLAGPLIGALFMVSLPELLRGWVEYQWVMFGLTLILVMRFLPGGLSELGGRIVSFWQKRRGAP